MATTITRYDENRQFQPLEETYRCLEDPAASERARGCRELGKLGQNGAANYGTHETCLGMLEDYEASVQAAAVMALGDMGSFGATYADLVVKKMGSQHKEVRRAAARALATLGPEVSGYASAVEGRLNDSDPGVVAHACVALGKMRAESSAQRLKQMLGGSNIEVVAAACTGLGYMEAGGDEVSALMSHQEPRVRAAAVGSFTRNLQAAEKYADKVATLVGDEDAYVRIAAVNVVSALGEKAAAHCQKLGQLCESKDAGVRAAAAAALGGVGESAASQVDKLEKLLSDTNEDKSTLPLSVAGVQNKVAPAFRKPACAAAASLAVLGGAAKKTAPKLAEGLNSPDLETRVQCACALGKLGAAAAQWEENLVDLLEDTQPMVIAAACHALGDVAEATKTPTHSIAEKVAGCLQHKHPAVRAAACKGLAGMGEETKPFLEDVVKCFDDRAWYVRSQAVNVIPACGELGQMFAGQVCRMMFDPEVGVRLIAAATLPKLGERGAAFHEEVGALLNDALPQVRMAAIKCLETMGDKAEALQAALTQLAENDQSEEVQEAAKQAVSGMTKALKAEEEKSEEVAVPAAEE